MNTQPKLTLEENEHPQNIDLDADIKETAVGSGVVVDEIVLTDMAHPATSTSYQYLFDDLQRASELHQNTAISKLFDQNPNRVSDFSIDFNDIYVDFSKHHLDETSKKALIEYATHCGLSEKRAALFAGEKINDTEKRAVLHMALRGNIEDDYSQNGMSVMPHVLSERDKCYAFSELVRNGDWLGTTGKPITTIVNIGIGGSDLGPQLLIDALADYVPTHLNIQFISRLDGKHVARILNKLDAETTLFIVASKTFSTLETIENAKACRAWLTNKLGDSATEKHFVAVSTNVKATAAFGIDPNNVFGFWDWVGGRFSVWSSVGLSVMIAIGKTEFSALLEGAREADQHFLNTPFENNIPVMMGLLGFWYGCYFKSSAHVILSYDETLRVLPSYLQQLDMESNGKSIDHNGQKVQHPTGPVIFGGLGNDGQHAYYQWLHQGQMIVPADFFAATQATIESDILDSAQLENHHALLLANCFAQSQAMMLGKNAHQVRDELSATGYNEFDISALQPYKVFEGGRPSTTFLYPHMTPKILGSLLAFYEHKIFVQGVLWNINSFDQWGVELGKELAGKLIPLLSQDKNTLLASSIDGQKVTSSESIGFFKRLKEFFSSKNIEEVNSDKTLQNNLDASTLGLIKRTAASRKGN